MLAPQKKLLNDLTFFFFALFVLGSTFSIALAQSALGISLILFLTTAILTRRNPLAPQLRWLYGLVAAYVVWMALASILGETPLRSLKILKEEWLFLIVPIGVYLLRREGYRNKLMLVVSVGVGLVSLYGIVQYLTGLELFRDAPLVPAPGFGYRVRGAFTHRLTFGNFYAVAACFLAAYALIGWKSFPGRLRYLFLAAPILAAAATILTFSRGPLLWMIVTLAVLGLVLVGRKMIALLGVGVVTAVLVVLFSPGLQDRVKHNWAKETDSAYQGARMYIFSRTVELIADHPVFGVGQGNFGRTYEQYVDDTGEAKRVHVHAHNDVLNVAALSGIPGAAAFAGMWVVVFCLTISGWRSARGDPQSSRFYAAACMGSMAFFLCSLSEATFADEEVRQFLMFVWAVGLWQLTDQGDRVSAGTANSAERKSP